MLNEFYIKGTWEENIEGCYQFSSMGWVLVSPQHFRSKIPLSRWCRKPRQKWQQNMTMMVDQQSDQKYRSKVIIRQQKVVNEWEKPSIYKKILSQSRYWCIIKILLTKSRSNFYGIFYYICQTEKEFDLGHIPLFVNNK